MGVSVGELVSAGALDSLGEVGVPKDSLLEDDDGRRSALARSQT